METSKRYNDVRLLTFTTSTRPVWPFKRKKIYTNDIAKCGWYLSKNPLTCTCVCCGAVRSEFNGSDDPFAGHKLSCALSSVWRNVDGAGIDERESTYEGWVHADIPNLSARKMSEAGFIFFPLSDAPDMVLCPYCMVSLDGWEPTDDPTVEHRKRKENCSFFKGTGQTTKVRKRVVHKTKAKTTESQRAASPVASEAESVVPSEADMEPESTRGMEETQKSIVDEEVEVEKTRADAPIRKYRQKQKPDDEADVSEVSDKENNVGGSITEQEVAHHEMAPAVVNEQSGANRRARGKQVQTRHETTPANVVESTEELRESLESNVSVMQEAVAVRRPRRERARAVNYAEDDFDLDGKPKKTRRNSTELRQKPSALEPEVNASIRQANDITTTKKAGLKASTARSIRVDVPRKRNEQSKSDTSSQGVAVDESFGSEIGDSEIDSMSITNDMEGDDVDPPLGGDQMEIDIPEEETANASIPLTIRGMPNLPKFCEHINVPSISPETLMGATANLTEDERKMTVEEYLRAQAQSACDELVRRRLHGWRQVDDEFNKLRMWIEALPET